MRGDVTADITKHVTYNVKQIVTSVLYDHLEVAMTTTDISILEKRSAANTIQRAKEILGLNFSEVAEALGVQRQTVYRYRKLESVPNAEVQERLAKIREISYLLSEVFIDEGTQLEWLYSPVPLLRERRPIDLIRKGEFDEVMSVLAGHYSGAFA